jgi:RNA recognition motif-containing protein
VSGVCHFLPEIRFEEAQLLVTRKVDSHIVVAIREVRSLSHWIEQSCHKENLVGKKLYVGNLSYSVTHTDLAAWFAQYGTVQSAQVIQDRDIGTSKGFGFVEMDTDAQAEAAIQGLHDNEHDGRRLTVAEAKPRVAHPGGFAGANGRQY